jgi:hypothetical protein
VGACLCVVLAVLSAFEVFRDRADRARGMPSKWLGIAAAAGLAVAVLVVDPAARLNGRTPTGSVAASATDR